MSKLIFGALAIVGIGVALVVAAIWLVALTVIALVGALLWRLLPRRATSDWHVTVVSSSPGAPMRDVTPPREETIDRPRLPPTSREPS